MTGQAVLEVYQPRLLEIPYPWPTFKAEARMPLSSLFGLWMDLYLPKDFGKTPQLSYEEYTENVYQFLFGMCAEDIDRYWCDLSRSHSVSSGLITGQPCAESEMAAFLDKLIAELGSRHGWTTPVRRPEWKRDHRYGVMCYPPGQQKDLVDEYWEVEVEQWKWIEDRLPSYHPQKPNFQWTDAESIDRSRGMMLVRGSGFVGGDVRVERVHLTDVFNDFITLGLEADFNSILQDMARIEELLNKWRKIKRKQDEIYFGDTWNESTDEVLKNLHEQDRKLYKEVLWLEGQCYPIEKHPTLTRCVERSDGDRTWTTEEPLVTCTNEDRERIKGFVEKYGFPFIPYEHNLRDNSPYYFDAFKAYWLEFVAIYLKATEDGAVKPFSSLDTDTLRQWIGKEASISLQTATFKGREGTTVRNTPSERTRCSFVTLARVLAKLDKQVRNIAKNGLPLIDDFGYCKYCGGTVLKQRGGHLQFLHCSDPECKKDAANDRRKWRRANDPVLRKKLQKQERKRQKSCRARKAAR